MMAEESKSNSIEEDVQMEDVPFQSYIAPPTVDSIEPSPMDESTDNVAIPSSADSINAPPSAPPTPQRTAPKKRRSGIDGLEIDEKTIYAMAYGEDNTSKLRTAKSRGSAGKPEEIKAAAKPPIAPEKHLEHKRKKQRTGDAPGDQPQSNGHASSTASSKKKKPSAAASSSSSSSKSQPNGISSNPSSSSSSALAPPAKRKYTKRGTGGSAPSASPPVDDLPPPVDLDTLVAGDLDPATVMSSVHADLEKERVETERKRAEARAKRMVIPKDIETKNLYAQRYRLLQERMSFIKRRHEEFYLAQIVNRYPTPRFPYLDSRNLHLWHSDPEARRAVERVVTDAKKKLQEETIALVLKQEAARREAEAAAAADEEGKKKGGKATAAKNNSASQKGKKTRKKMAIAAVQDDEDAKPADSLPVKLGRQTQNSLADSLALETAILMSTAEAPQVAAAMAETSAKQKGKATTLPVSTGRNSASPTSQAESPTNHAAASASVASPTTTTAVSNLQTALAAVQFSRTTPLLRPGNFILWDNPEEDDWEAGRIVAVSASRTKMWVEPAVVEDEEYPETGDWEKGARKRRHGAVLDEDGKLSIDTGYGRCIDLRDAHVFEYVDVVWCKVAGYDWWPAELCEEIENGVLCPTPKGQVHVAFCEEPRKIQTVRLNGILPFYDYYEDNTKSKQRRKGFEASLQAADVVWKSHMWQNVIEESLRRERESDYLHSVLKDYPTYFFGKRVSVYWPLDEAWYSGVIKQYNLQTKKHCILYDDDAVEWLDVQKEKVVFAPVPLAVDQQAELPTNPQHIRMIYKSYLHQLYELKSPQTFVYRDFLPDYFPRSIEQVDPKEVGSDPKDAKLVANAKLRKAQAPNPATFDSGLDLNNLICWECGLDLEKWNGPGLLTTKYGGTSNPNKKEEPPQVISCGRCTKVVHSFCLKLMLKRKNQTEHALPAVVGSDGEAEQQAVASDTVEVDSSEKVLPPHLSCSLANPRCPDCLRCEFCFLISNKNASVEDLVTCDVCHIRAHLQCIDPAFDPEKHKRPTDGWVCTMCVQCRCCGATHSKGGKTTLPPLPPPPGEEQAADAATGDSPAALLASPDSTESAVANPAASDDSAPMDTSDSAPLAAEAARATSDGSHHSADQATSIAVATAAAAKTQVGVESPIATEEAEATPMETGTAQGLETQTEAGNAEPETAVQAMVLQADEQAPDNTPVAGGEDSSALPAKRKKKKKQNWKERLNQRHTASAKSKSDDYVPFSKRFISKWVDTDDEEHEEQEEVPEEPEEKKQSTELVVYESDTSFWEWTNSFTVCQPCGYRLEKRKYCPICVVIYDRNTTDPMVQCDSCERWVHIACDPNAQANEAKLTKDNTQYRCAECIRRERANELTGVLDELVSNPRGRHFMHPVDEKLAPDYFLTIKCPMDFQTVYKKLSELQYRSLDDFRSDLNLIWRNAKDYNPPGSGIYKSAVALAVRSMELFKALQEKHAKGGLFDETIGRIEDEEEERRKAAAEKELRDQENKRKKQLKRQSEAQYPRPPRLDYYAFYLSFDDVRLCEIDTCLLCGSIGDDCDLLFCVDCGECAHSWCYASSLEADADAGIGERIDTSIFTAMTAEQKQNFRCPNCQTCSQCGTQEKRIKIKEGERVNDSFVTCSQCKDISHVSCVPYLNGHRPRHADMFKCPKCVICRCCQATTAGKHPNDVWSSDYTLCHACNKLYQAGNVCPVCDMVYKPRDDSTPMMCCDVCQNWIHMACDNIRYEQYMQMTADSSKKYFCPHCRASGETSEQLSRRVDESAARRLVAGRKKQERNKFQTSIAYLPEPLPQIHHAFDLMNAVSHLLDRIQAHQHRMSAMKRHRATVMTNSALQVERAQRGVIPAMEEPKSMAPYVRQATRTFQLLEAASSQRPESLTPLSIPLSSVPCPVTHAPATVEVYMHEDDEEETQQENEADGSVQMEDVVVKQEAGTTEATPTIKLEPSTQPTDAPVAIASAVTPLVTAAPSSTSDPAATAVSVVDAVAAAPSDARLAPLPSSDVGSIASVADAAVASSSIVTLPTTAALTPEQALNYLNSEAARSARKDDWRICAFCHKRGDRDMPQGEGRLLPALCLDGRWVHVQCALWTDRVSTNVKGQMNIFGALHKVADSICTVCSLPGASLRCKKGMATCGRYHFACALNRHCLFTVDKEFFCETHSSQTKRSQERQAVIDKICRRMLIANNRFNVQGIFAMRAKEFVMDRNSPDLEVTEVLTREELKAQEALLSNYFIDYEDIGNSEWKTRKLAFASKATLKELEADSKRALAKGEEEEQQSAMPTLPLSERITMLQQYTQAQREDQVKREDEPMEPRVKEEDEPTAMEVDGEDAEQPSADVVTGAAAAAGSSSSALAPGQAPKLSKAQRERLRRERSRRKDKTAAEQKGATQGGKPTPPKRTKEMDQLLQSLPPVTPSTPVVFLRIGALSVTNLGEVVPESRWFHDLEYIYPLGYMSSRIYWSYKRPGQRATYVCEILGQMVVDPNVPVEELQQANGNLYSTTDQCPLPSHLVPLFRITVSDDTAQPIIARSAPAAWKTLMSHFPSFISRNTIRPRMRSGDTFSWSLGGSAFFGLSMKQVMFEVEHMPRADFCTKYKFKHLLKMIEAQKAAQVAREQARIKAGLPEGEYLDEVPRATAATAASTAAPAPTPAAIEAAEEVQQSGCARTHGYDRRVKMVQIAGALHNPSSGLAELEGFSSIAVIADDPNGARRRKAMLQSVEKKALKDIPLWLQYKIMKASAPRARVAHSVIHEWGLFANQDLEEGAMVIEYLGELIRPRVADIREKYYEDTGQVSCYMFRIDDDYIVDSTKRGNISRFINHSCDPNCHTECIETTGGKKIVVLANRAIAKDDEITYDYFFASEEERIRCNCGAINCAGRLN